MIQKIHSCVVSTFEYIIFAWIFVVDWRKEEIIDILQSDSTHDCWRKREVHVGCCTKETILVRIYKTKAVDSKILPILKCILNRQRMIRGRNEIVQTSFHFRSIYDVQFCMSNKFINNVILKIFLVFNFSSKHDLVLWIHCWFHLLLLLCVNFWIDPNK